MKTDSCLKLTVKDSATTVAGESTIIDMIAMIDTLVQLVHNETAIPVNEILENFKTVETELH